MKTKETFDRQYKKALKGTLTSGYSPLHEKVSKILEKENDCEIMGYNGKGEIYFSNINEWRTM